jgi:transposase
MRGAGIILLGAVKVAKGRPRLRPQRIVGEKGYSSRAIRQYARRHGIRITIPCKRHECRKGPFDRALYKQRQLVERMINRLKQFRRLATRYEKRGANHVVDSGNPLMVIVCKRALIPALLSAIGVRSVGAHGPQTWELHMLADSGKIFHPFSDIFSRVTSHGSNQRAADND